MTTLVTGGAGFVGSHVAARLLEQGEDVVVIDNFNDYYDPALKRSNAARLSAHPRAVVVEGDIRDVPLLKQLFEDHGIDRVAHMAAMAGVRFSVNEVPLYMDVNVTGTMNLLEAARHHKAQQFVFASTSSVYGKTELLPFIETDMADRPLAAYPASKRGAEILAYSYHHLFGMDINILRFFNVYGPAGRPDMMPWRLMESITRGEEITVFNDGDIYRDWTYIDDIVAGVLAALERPMGYEIMNLGVGQPISLNEFIQTIETLVGKQAIRKSVPTPMSDPPITYCNNEKARQLLGFDPQTTVSDGLAKTWDWYRDAFKL